MKKSIIAFIMVLIWGAWFVNADVYKWKAQTGETRTRRDGTTYNIWDRTDLSEATFNELKDTEFKDARVVENEYATHYIIEKDGKQIVLTRITEDKDRK